MIKLTNYKKIFVYIIGLPIIVSARLPENYKHTGWD